MSILPHSAKIRADCESYLDELESNLTDNTRSLKSSGDFRHIFKVCSAADAVFEKLSMKERPRLIAARYIVRRSPVLIVAGQIDAARRDIRRLIEVILWCIYFSDHPIEWARFQKDPVSGRFESIESPIAFCAYRERVFYANYALERFGDEPSGLAKTAVLSLNATYAALNAFAHGGHALLTDSVHPALDPIDGAMISSFSSTLHEVCAASSIATAALFVSQFDRLPPMYRGWFDWLIGKEKSKVLRSGAFGLSEPSLM